MVLKLDLEKVYDRLEWDFIYRFLIHFKFPKIFIKVIMECDSFTSISILLNGGILDSFYPSRGLHQGDPLSPYLFITCMDYFSFLIEEETRNLYGIYRFDSLAIQMNTINWIPPTPGTEGVPVEGDWRTQMLLESRSEIVNKL